ncbi:metallophosphoesterase family protein [Amycolatopsis pithecellobii]|uniref:Calcineurin-like phosphoesterase domain-containing protein n=1 Tax=Amycolatopsis pithecellobii TaxID=664692 RepID=A0A6N7Z0P1_9PSEU|nr:metallophosphoesterase [Amycolatopsis pithecellobii]MTD54279.1 hypothetical protein [Amycolatopsis pithecellobii]
MTSPLPTRSRTRLGVLTDCHLAAPGTPDARFNNPVLLSQSRKLLTDALSWLTGQVDALVLLGDLAQSATPDDYDYLFAQMAATKLPIYLVPGNHDFPPDSPHPAAALRSPSNGALVPPPTGISFGTATLTSGDLTAEPEGFRLLVDGNLPASTPLVWLSHFPVLSLESTVHDQNLRYAGDLLNRAEVERTLQERRGPVVALTGHLHVRGHAIANSVLQLNMGPLVESPHDASVVTIDVHGNQITVDRATHRLADGDNATIFDPEHTTFDWDGTSWRALSRRTEHQRDGNS